RYGRSVPPADRPGRACRAWHPPSDRKTNSGQVLATGLLLLYAGRCAPATVRKEPAHETAACCPGFGFGPVLFRRPEGRSPGEDRHPEIPLRVSQGPRPRRHRQVLPGPRNRPGHGLPGGQLARPARAREGGELLETAA